jgi:outer membrane immunogenic protein
VKRIASIGSLAISLFAGSAFGADLPSQSEAPYYTPPPLFTWTGLYLGINGGVGIGSFTSGGNPYFGNTSGGLVGGTIGYNYQGGPIVVGLEADLDWADINGSNTALLGLSGKGTINEMNTIRGRLGYSFEKALVYVTGGYAGGIVSGNLANFAAAPNFLGNESHYLNGYAVGVGLEYMITPRISAKAEYMYNSLSPSGYFGGTLNAINSGVNVSTVKAGLNYHF